MGKEKKTIQTFSEVNELMNLEREEREKKAVSSGWVRNGSLFLGLRVHVERRLMGLEHSMGLVPMKEILV